MGTRSFIAEPYGESWRGRYVHWDGYPTSKGPMLQALIARDGREAVLETILHRYYGWSSLHPTQPDITGVEPDVNAPYGSPAYEASRFTSDGRFANVPGYGIAYTTEQGQSSEDQWITPEGLASGEDWDTEWGYVVFPREIVVMSCYDHWERKEIVPIDEPVDWDKIEAIWAGED